MSGARDVLDGLIASAAFQFTERAFLDLVNLRGDGSDPAFVDAVEQVTGTRVPTQPNTVSSGLNCSLVWLGPDEWFVRSSLPQAPVFETKLAQALNGQFASVVDVGSGYTVFEIRGTRVREVLARGCPLDLHPRRFKEGQCAQSLFFKAAVVLMPTRPDAFDVIVRRSFADYVCRMMLDAAAPLAP